MNRADNDKLISESLNDCFERMLVGEPLESCLAAYPAQAGELKPLLETMRAGRCASELAPDPTFRARARYEFRRTLSERWQKPQTAVSWRLRMATAVSTLGVFLLAGGGSVMAASANAMPGQVLYELKRNVESVQTELAPSQAARARLNAGLADRRVTEIVYAAGIGDAALTEDLTRQFTSNLLRVSEFGTAAGVLASDNGSKQILTTGLPEDSRPVSTTTAPAMAPPFGAGSLTPSTAPVAPLPVMSLSDITDPVLLKLLQQYSVKNIAELMAVLDSVPAETREALLAAIQAANSGYGQLLGQ